MTHVHVDELDAIELPEGFVWRPVRRRFGIRAFGVNAYTATRPGGRIVEEHDEGDGGHEEIYTVVRGRVRFTVGGDEHDVGPGTFVFVRDSSLTRGAVALTEDAVVLALGGQPGQPHHVSPWEAVFASLPARERGDREEEVRVLEEGLAEVAGEPGEPALLYALARAEARRGHTVDALLRLRRAVDLDPPRAARALAEPDFVALRREPGFPAA